MEQRHYLIDSNSVIDYLGNKLPVAGMSFMNVVIDAIPSISIITKIKILGYPTPDEHDEVLHSFIADSKVLSLNDNVADRCIALRKITKIKLPDAIITATALVNNLTLVTRNTSDFKNVDGLDTINPHEV